MAKTFASFGDPPAPEPEPAATPGIPALYAPLVPVLDTTELAKITLRIERAIYKAVEAGWKSALEDLAAEPEDPPEDH